MISAKEDNCCGFAACSQTLSHLAQIVDIANRNRQWMEQVVSPLEIKKGRLKDALFWRDFLRLHPPLNQLPAFISLLLFPVALDHAVFVPPAV